MKQSIKNQSGLTFMGLCFVLVIIAVFVLFGLRVFPLYNEKLQIEAAINAVVNQPDSADQSASALGRRFMRAMAVNNINLFTDRNVKNHLKLVKSKKKSEPNMLHFTYRNTNVLVADLKLLLTYDKQFPLLNSKE